MATFTRDAYMSCNSNIIHFYYKTTEKQCYYQALCESIGTVQVLFSDLCGFALSCLVNRLTLSPTIFHPAQDVAVQRSFLAIGLYCCLVWLLSQIHTQSMISLLSRSVCVQVKILMEKAFQYSSGDFIVFIYCKLFYCFPFPLTLPAVLYVGCQVCQSTPSHLPHTNPYLLLVQLSSRGQNQEILPPLVPQGHPVLS